MTITTAPTINPVRRSTAAFALTLALALGLVGANTAPVSAQTTGQDNTAVAINTNDGSSLFRFAFNITRVTSEVADAGNAAVAFASCTECQTVAIAIQIVIIEGSPDVFTPENLAIAMNVNCNTCDTLASAYQFVFQGDTRLRLTPEGRRELVGILNELRRLRDSGLSGPEIQAEVDALADRIFQVFSTQLQPVGDGPSGEGEDDPSDSTTSTAPTVTPTTARSTTTVVVTTTTVKSTTTTSPSSTTTSPTSTTTTTAP